MQMVCVINVFIFYHCPDFSVPVSLMLHCDSEHVTEQHNVLPIHSQPWRLLSCQKTKSVTQIDTDRCAFMRLLSSFALPFLFSRTGSITTGAGA